MAFAAPSSATLYLEIQSAALEWTIHTVACRTRSPEFYSVMWKNGFELRVRHAIVLIVYSSATFYVSRHSCALKCVTNATKKHRFCNVIDIWVCYLDNFTETVFLSGIWLCFNPTPPIKFFPYKWSFFPFSDFLIFRFYENFLKFEKILKCFPWSGGWFCVPLRIWL